MIAEALVFDSASPGSVGVTRHSSRRAGALTTANRVL